MSLTRLRAAVGLAVAQLRYYRVRTLLAVVGVAIAVLAALLLASLGLGVHSFGSEGMQSIGGDVWVTGESVAFSTAVGGVETDLRDAHRIAGEIQEREDVLGSPAIHFQSVYVATEPGEYETVVGAGVTGQGSWFNIEEGTHFAAGDVHYADGDYDGPMSGEVMLDRRTADLLGVGVGDEIHAGGTLHAADEHTFTVVGITNDVTRYMGAPTAIFHLAELQQVSGTTRQDPATAILVALEDDADPAEVRAELAADYPELVVRSPEEQFTAYVQEQTLVLGAAAAVLVLAIGGGIALVANVLGMLVYQQRRELAAAKASGVSPATLRRAVLAQGLLVGLAGGILGSLAVYPSVDLLNRVVAHVTGFEEILAVHWWVLGIGMGMALGVGVVGATVAGWLVTRVDAVEHLEA